MEKAKEKKEKVRVKELKKKKKKKKKSKNGSDEVESEDDFKNIDKEFDKALEEARKRAATSLLCAYFLEDNFNHL